MSDKATIHVNWQHHCKVVSDNEVLTARIEELESLLRKCRHMLNEHGRVDQKTVTLIVDRGRYQHLQRELSAALTPEEPK